MTIEQFDYFINVIQSLLWQYNEATSLETLVTGKQNWLDTNQNTFWTNWYTDVFNLQTANDFGLAVWAIILNMPLFINLNPDPPGKPIWGFGSLRKNFNNGNFARTPGGIVLTTEEKRIVLKLRYWQFVNRGAALETNFFLNFVFQDLGQVYMLDGLNMTITYVFLFKPSYDLLSVLIEYDLLPRPAAVGIKYVDSTRKTWGFGQYRKNFNNGTFINEIYDNG